MYWRIALLALYALALGAGSLITVGAPDGGHVDKLLHFLAYGVFALMAYTVAASRRQFALLCLGIVAYGIALEWLQSLTATRSMSAADALANAAGVAVVFAGLRATSRRER